MSHTGPLDPLSSWKTAAVSHLSPHLLGCQACHRRSAWMAFDEWHPSLFLGGRGFGILASVQSKHSFLAVRLEHKARDPSLPSVPLTPFLGHLLESHFLQEAPLAQQNGETSADDNVSPSRSDRHSSTFLRRLRGV